MGFTFGAGLSQVNFLDKNKQKNHLRDTPVLSEYLPNPKDLIMVGARYLLLLIEG